ncbi:MAG: sulfite exporter TauE/SafE family protein [Hyphomicrobiaceae bacterium]
MDIYLPVAELSMNLLLLFGIGLAVGVLSGMFGIGGGFIMTPLLIFLGVPPAIAVGTGASQVVASSVASALGHWRRDNVDLKMGVLLIGGGLVGAISGVFVQTLLRRLGQLDLVISLTYVVVLGVIGTLMLSESIQTFRRSRGGGKTSSRKAGQHTWVQGLPLKQRFHKSKLYASAIPPVLIGLLVGWLTAIMGVGGGFLIVPALIYLMSVPTRVAIGTSVFQIVFLTGITTILQAVQNKTVDVMLAFPLMVGGVIGAQYGIDIGQRLNAVQLRGLLAALVLLVALRMAIDLALTPADLYSIQRYPY